MSSNKLPGDKSSSKRSLSPKGNDFESSLAQLEKLVARMESGELGLEESLKAVEEGVRLTRLCQETLSAAEQKVQRLMEEQGKVSLQDLHLDDDEDDTRD